MIILIAIKGGEEESFFHRVALLAPLREAERVLLAHVIDITLRGQLDLGREFHLGHRRLPEDRDADLWRAEEEHAQAGTQFARQALIHAGVAEERLEEVIQRGNPGEEIRRLAVERQADLIVVRGRAEKPGPKSIGKTARFLIDHAPASALLIR